MPMVFCPICNRDTFQFSHKGARCTDHSRYPEDKPKDSLLKLRSSVTIRPYEPSKEQGKSPRVKALPKTTASGVLFKGDKIFTELGIEPDVLPNVSADMVLCSFCSKPVSRALSATTGTKGAHKLLIEDPKILNGEIIGIVSRTISIPNRAVACPNCVGSLDKVTFPPFD